METGLSYNINFMERFGHFDSSRLKAGEVNLVGEQSNVFSARLHTPSARLKALSRSQVDTIASRERESEMHL